jgi:hypothetical protein
MYSSSLQSLADRCDNEEKLASDERLGSCVGLSKSDLLTDESELRRKESAVKKRIRSRYTRRSEELQRIASLTTQLPYGKAEEVQYAQREWCYVY